MKIVRYIDLIDTVEDDEGEVYERLLQENFTLPTIIDGTRVDSICPYFTKYGKVFKNVSVINYNGELFKVVGNYQDLNKQRYRVGNTIGFINGKQKQESIEGRTKIKSTTKRRTKRSNK